MTGPRSTLVASPSYVAGLVRDGKVRPKRGLGQNFLVDRNVVGRIIRVLGLPPDGRGKGVLEIGAGLGGLTLALAEAGASPVIAVEKDPVLAGLLREVVSGRPAVRVVEGDVLEVDLRTLASGLDTVVGNLPYAITTPLLFRLLEPPLFWATAVIMVQLEVAERILAAPGGKDYGALTLAVRAVAGSSLAFKVSRRCFLPEPGVDSAVLTLTRAEPAGGLEPEALGRLSAVVRAAFGQRRKTLANAISSGLDLPRDMAVAAISAAGINPARRGETLSLDEFVVLERALRPVIETGGASGKGFRTGL